MRQEPYDFFSNQDLLTDSILDYMADALVREQGFRPTGIETLERHREKEKYRIFGILEDTFSAFTEGLEILETDTDTGVAGFSRVLTDRIHDPETQTDIIEEKRLSLREPCIDAVFRLFSGGEFRKAEKACAAVVLLYPLDPAPIALAGAITREVRGLEAACSFYEGVVQIIEDPMTDFYAAECFYSKGDRKKAEELFARIFSLCNGNHEKKKHYSDQIQALVEGIPA